MDNNEDDLKKLFINTLTMYESLIPIWIEQKLKHLEKFTAVQEDINEFPFQFQSMLIASKAASFSETTLRRYPKEQISELILPDVFTFDLLTPPSLPFENFADIIARHRRAVEMATALIFLRDEYFIKLGNEKIGKLAVMGDPQLLGANPKAFDELMSMIENSMASGTCAQLDKCLNDHDAQGGSLRQIHPFEIYTTFIEKRASSALPLKSYIPDEFDSELRDKLVDILDTYDAVKPELLSDAAKGNFRMLKTKAHDKYYEEYDKLLRKGRSAYDEKFLDEQKTQHVPFVNLFTSLHPDGTLKIKSADDDQPHTAKNTPGCDNPAQRLFDYCYGRPEKELKIIREILTNSSKKEGHAANLGIDRKTLDTRLKNILDD